VESAPFDVEILLVANLYQICDKYYVRNTL